MLQPLKEFICEKLFKHPVLHVEMVDPKNPTKTDFLCKCCNCDKWFLTNEAGLRKMLETHDPKSLTYPPKPPNP